VASSLPGEPDEHGHKTRQGWNRLREYFCKATGHDPLPTSVEQAVKYHGRPLPDWCGIFAVWAMKSAGLPIGNWVFRRGIGAVPGMASTTSPQRGDVGFLNHGEFKGHQHMDIIAEVNDDGTISTIDGNSTAGRVTGPTPRPRSLFDGFYTAFHPKTVPATPQGLWLVHVGDWTWRYYFHSNNRVDWRDIKQPQLVRGWGAWEIGTGSRQVPVLRVNWQTGTIEEWDLPLNPQRQTGLSMEDLSFIRAQKIG